LPKINRAGTISPIKAPATYQGQGEVIFISFQYSVFSGQ